MLIESEDPGTKPESKQPTKIPSNNQLRDEIFRHLNRNESDGDLSSSCQEIVEVAAKVWMVRPDDIIGHQRPVRFCLPRFAVCAELRTRGYTYQDIANAIGGRDHGTIIHCVKACLAELQTSRTFRDRYRSFLVALDNIKSE